jgi:hypothetical protein
MGDQTYQGRGHGLWSRTGDPTADEARIERVLFFANDNLESATQFMKPMAVQVSLPRCNDHCCLVSAPLCDSTVQTQLAKVSALSREAESRRISWLIDCERQRLNFGTRVWQDEGGKQVSARMARIESLVTDFNSQ